MENNKRLVLVLGLKEEKGLRVFAVTESMVGFLKLPIWSERQGGKKELCPLSADDDASSVTEQKQSLFNSAEILFSKERKQWALPVSLFLASCWL